ncbi:iron-containing alcohol dehydrogenase [Exiguobacterium sp. SL14]|nr:iron-containing alcohol dehydrogenase [Exiguobacterium sp. SL14]MCY1692315.1 iron-containing alcohol dehydrogenase [Exiguobacterium sp. SL14]
MIRQAVLQYIHEENALDQLEQIIGNRSAVLIHGRQAYEAAAFALPDVPHFLFEGHCTDRQVEALKLSCAPYDVILALGGGSVIDTAKQVAFQLQLRLSSFRRSFRTVLLGRRSVLCITKRGSISVLIRSRS